LSRNIKLRIYKTIILTVVLYGCGIWSLTLRDEYRLKVFQNSVLRIILGLKKDEGMEGWRNYIMRSFVICTLIGGKVRGKDTGGCKTLRWILER
jgi:hypothetical protein